MTSPETKKKTKPKAAEKKAKTAAKAKPTAAKAKPTAAKAKTTAAKDKATAAKAKPKANRGRKKKAPDPGPALEPQAQKVVIASDNPAKVKAVKIGFERMFPELQFTFEEVAVETGVGEQPMSDDETFAGALQSTFNAREKVDDAAFYVGLESGVDEIEDELHAFAWMVVMGPDKMVGKARTATFVLPPAVSELVREGKELGEADDIVFGTEDSKKDTGAVGILTHGLVDRASFFSEAVIMALIPFKNYQLFMVEEEVQ